MTNGNKEMYGWSQDMPGVFAGKNKRRSENRLAQ